MRTDEFGKVIGTEQRSVRCFDEDLGTGITLTMIEIPEGEFIMGSPRVEDGHQPDEEPQHAVRIRRFFLGQFEITDQQWEGVRKLPRVHTKLYESLNSLLAKQNPTLPADGIRYRWAVEFCDRLSRLTGKQYRLPSEAEWEYAARSGSGFAYSYGPAITNDIVNWRRQNFSSTSAGTSGPANAFGLYDMNGNSEEWVADRYHPNFVNAPTDGSPWISKSGQLDKEDQNDHVLRGGAYSRASILNLRSSARWHFSENAWATGFGMRVALSADE